MVLANSLYPDCVPKEFEVSFESTNGVLIVNYQLPAPEHLPTIIEVKYNQSSGAFVTKNMTAPNHERLFESVVYQIVLRSVHELFEADVVDAISSVVFNGIVTALDRASGNNVTAYIVSLHVTKVAFAGINLRSVDPKSCFRQLKGVGSPKLHALSPVAPIMQIKSDDPRFVEAYGVAEYIQEGYNLASMHWEDFEHLVRELFEREFSTNGGEVKVTQASRDGGVDAIAFDPDPIRGGKIVIQAKRYTNVVGVSAVRDLYGTLINEGASRGILVTTSEFGPDAFEFAKSKPLTLLTGANLLHLLQKQGIKARIDIAEARRFAQKPSA